MKKYTNILAMALALTSGNIFAAATWGTPVVVSSGVWGQTGSTIEVADIDGQNGSDILISKFFHPSSTDVGVIAFLNNGDNTFTDVGVIITGLNNMYYIEAADVDGTNGPDILVVGPTISGCLLYLNNGDGTFGTGNAIADSGSGFSGSSILAADFDGDNDLDVFAQRFNSSGPMGASWFQNTNGMGNYANGINTDVSGNDGNFASPKFADIDNDGIMDIAGANNDGAVFIRRPDNAGSFSSLSFLTTIPFAYGFDVADFDGSPGIDYASVSRGTNEIVIATNDGSGNFSQTTLLSSAFGIQDLAAADFDLDGDVDIIYADTPANTIEYFENNGFGTFTTGASIANSLSVVSRVLAVDVDSDGDKDIVAINEALFDPVGNVWFIENLSPSASSVGSWNLYD